MNVGALGPVGGGGAGYALSPFLNGVRRTSDAVTATMAQPGAAAAATPPTQASAARAAAITPAAPPFANPAIAQIAQNAAISASLTPPPVTAAPASAAPGTTAAPAAQASPTASVLYGDSGEMVQAYGAVALIEPPLGFAPIYVQPAVPAVPAVAPVSRIPRIARIT